MTEAVPGTRHEFNERGDKRLAERGVSPMRHLDLPRKKAAGVHRKLQIR